MKISFCTIGFQKNKWGRDRIIEVPIDRILPILGRSGAGYDGVELWYGHIEGVDLSAVKAQLVAEALAVPMVSHYYDFTGSDESAAASLEKAREVLAAAKTLNAAALRIFTGRVGSAAATPEQWERGVRSLQTLADLAAAANIRLACETHSNNLMDTVDSSLTLLRRVARPNVGLILQPSTFKDNCLAACETLAPHAFHVHATNGKDGKGTALADGAMDYRQIVSILRKASFTGYICIEWMGEDPTAMARREAPYLRQLLNG